MISAAAAAIGRGALTVERGWGAWGAVCRTAKRPLRGGAGVVGSAVRSGAGGVSAGGLGGRSRKESRLKAASSCSAGRKPTAARGGWPGAKKATVGMLMIP